MQFHLGPCKDAFLIEGRGLVLGYHLYGQRGIRHGEMVTAKIVKEDGDIIDARAELRFVLGGKRLRYDMDPLGIIIVDKMINKHDVIGSSIILECDYQFWHPDL